MKFNYYNLNGKLGDYAKPFRTKSSTSSRDLIAFQTAINETISYYKDKEATADNCRLLWESLFNILNRNNLTPVEKKWNVYKEIVDKLQEIGEQLAFDTYRKGYYPTAKELNSYRNKFYFFTDFKNREEVEDNFITLMICSVCYWRNTKGEDASVEMTYLMAKDIYGAALKYKEWMSSIIQYNKYSLVNE